MSMAAPAADRAPRADASAASLFDSAPKVAVLAALLAQLLSVQKFIDVWRTGVFHDTDDAMRLAQVRDWLAGQSWFDMTATRFDPPDGVFMHWSRVVDVPLALLIRFFGLFAEPDTAERLCRLAFPFLMHIAFFAAFIALGRKLFGVRATAPAAFIGLFTMATTFQFVPGRIDHHAPQIVLLVLMMKATLDALDGGDLRPGLSAGAFAALSMAISVENLPFVIAMAGVFVVNWIARGRDATRPLTGLGVSLVLATALAYLATVGPQRYGHYELDALSTAYLFAALACGAACAALSGASCVFLKTIPARLTAAVVAGLVLAGLLAFASPGVLRDPGSILDPFAGLDPLVRRIWLSNVLEALPLWRIVTLKPAEFLPFALPMLAGLAGIAAAIWFEPGKRPQWLAVAAFGGVGLLAACWAVRASASAAPLLVLGGLWVVLRVADRAATTEHMRLFGPMMAALPFVSVMWAQA